MTDRIQARRCKIMHVDCVRLNTCPSVEAGKRGVRQNGKLWMDIDSPRHPEEQRERSIVKVDEPCGNLTAERHFYGRNEFHNSSRCIRKIFARGERYAHAAPEKSNESFRKGGVLNPSNPARKSCRALPCRTFYFVNSGFSSLDTFRQCEIEVSLGLSICYPNRLS